MYKIPYITCSWRSKWRRHIQKMPRSGKAQPFRNSSDGDDDGIGASASTVLELVKSLNGLEEKSTLVTFPWRSRCRTSLIAYGTCRRCRCRGCLWGSREGSRRRCWWLADRWERCCWPSTLRRGKAWAPGREGVGRRWLTNANVSILQD